MPTVAEAEKLILGLSEKERAQLIGKLLRSLRPPSGAEGSDDSIAEALRRSDELKSNPEMGISIEELDTRIRERFGWKS